MKLTRVVPGTPDRQEFTPTVQTILMFLMLAVFGLCLRWLLP